MARLDRKGMLIGGIGNLSFRSLGGVSVVQSKPGKGNVKQTEATKRSAGEFGLANILAKKLRGALGAVLRPGTDAAVHRRLSSVMHAVIKSDVTHEAGSKALAFGDLALFKHFEFNLNSKMVDFCGFSPDLVFNGDVLQIFIPEFDAKAQIKVPMATHAEYCCVVTVLDADTLQLRRDDAFKLRFSCGDRAVPGASWVAEELLPHSLIFVTGVLLLTAHDRLMGDVTLNGKDLHPVQLLGVFKTI